MQSSNAKGKTTKNLDRILLQHKKSTTNFPSKLSLVESNVKALHKSRNSDCRPYLPNYKSTVETGPTDNLQSYHTTTTLSPVKEIPIEYIARPHEITNCINSQKIIGINRLVKV